ncbi:hypothetical protein BZG36_02800 [Bifiguratus adelaidae]|uniref:RGS domain-containing protein n=1 Tax=Bifiguratus adelaidae TaxID=1938954 RepID=A0A261Y1H5_9FUNG|nr:hypothetical protein BZG36_02800 [Bifiguratus adelaidae]
MAQPLDRPAPVENPFEDDNEKGYASLYTPKHPVVDYTAIYPELPTLDDVLRRKTQPPICLYNFYIIMRQRLHLEEYLDFYLDVTHHENLWRRYVRSLRRSGLVSEEDVANGYFNPALISRLSYSSLRKMSTSIDAGRPGTTQPTTSDMGRKSTDLPFFRQSESTSRSATPMPLFEDELSHHHPLQGQDSNNIAGGKLPLVTRKGIHDNAETIYAKYITPNAVKELAYLPPDIRSAIAQHFESNERDDPLIYTAAKQWCYEMMLAEAYPKFLRSKVWGNVTVKQRNLRVALGCLFLVIGFAFDLSLIFLGSSSGGIRWWGLVPIWLGVISLLVGATELDPIWVLIFNVSETIDFRFNKIKDPLVRRILVRRSLWVLLLSLVIAVLVTVVFVYVPGKRL